MDDDYIDALDMAESFADLPLDDDADSLEYGCGAGGVPVDVPDRDSKQFEFLGVTGCYRRKPLPNSDDQW